MYYYYTFQNNSRGKKIFNPGNKFYAVQILHENCVEFVGAWYKNDYSLKFLLCLQLEEVTTALYMNKSVPWVF